MAKGQELIKASDRRKANEEVAEEAKKKVIKAWGKILPFGAQVVASAAAYTAGVTATQLLGFVCKVSCATPVLGPCMGLLGVGFASALAGQASKHTRKMINTGASPLKAGFWEPLDMDDVVLDAFLGVFMFKAMGGRFSSLMPSDLAKPGALAFESIPARADNSESYARPSVKRELLRIFKRDGCHHCGSRRGPVIGDHMPPNKLVSVKSDDKFVTMIGELPGVGKVRELIGLAGRSGKPLQRFYPQCQRCSIKQATAMRNGKRVLVLHLHAPRYRSEHLAGIFVGIRHNVPPVDFPPAPTDTGRRSVSKWNPLQMIAAAPVDPEGTDGCVVMGMSHRSSNNTSSGSSGGHMQQQSPQLTVQELNPGSWDLGMQGYAPDVVPPSSRSIGGARSSSSSSQHQQGQQQGLYGGGSSSGHRGPYHKQLQLQSQERQGSKPQMLPGSMGLVQQQMGDVLQQPDRTPDGASLLVPLQIPEHAKQLSQAAFDRHFTNLAR